LSFYSAGKANRVPEIFWLDLRGHFEAGKGIKGKEKERKERKGREE